MIDSLLDAKSLIKGDVCFSGGMQIEGRVLGDVKGIGPDSILVIGQNATIEGSVEADRIFVDGTVNGPMKANLIVVVRPHGKITGDITYGKIQMEEGSQVKGQLLPIPNYKNTDSVEIVDQSLPIPA